MLSNIAAIVFQVDEKFKFQCPISYCLDAGNKSESSKNLIEHFKIKQKAVCRKLVALNEYNTTSSMLRNIIIAAKSRNLKSLNTRGMQRVFEICRTHDKNIVVCNETKASAKCCCCTV